MGLANHIGQTCNTSRLALPTERRSMPCLGNRSDLAGKIDRGGIDREGTSLCCLVEALEEGHLARCTARNHAPVGQESPHLVSKPAHLAP
jgi:hypothetical protein